MEAPAEFLAEMRAAYQQPPRAYHNWSHVEEVLGHVADVDRKVGWLQPREVWLAAVFHDAIYVAGAKDNEAKSAALARERIAHWFPRQGIDARRVARLVELTARHGSLAPGDVDSDEALLLDCDTAILGAAPEAFDAYDDGIAEEYANVVAPAAYRGGRRHFLEKLLARPRIFLSDHFHRRLDHAARANLARALARLALDG